MKKRIVKKWIKRYIHPVIEGLPKTEGRTGEFKHGDGRITVFSNNHTIFNGAETQEGVYAPLNARKCTNLLLNIKRTADKAREIRDSHEYVFLRLYEIRGNKVRLRIITE